MTLHLTLTRILKKLSGILTSNPPSPRCTHGRTNYHAKLLTFMCFTHRHAYVFSPSKVTPNYLYVLYPLTMWQCTERMHAIEHVQF